MQDFVVYVLIVSDTNFECGDNIYFSYIMNNIGFIEFAFGKIRYIFNPVLKCESIYLVHVLFYLI